MFPKFVPLFTKLAHPNSSSDLREYASAHFPIYRLCQRSRTAGKVGAPDDSPLLLRDTGAQEIYALDWQAP